MSAAQLTEWMAFYALEPFGCRAEDLRFGLLASIILNLFRGKEAPLRPSDLCPDYEGKGPGGQGLDLRDMAPGEVRALAGAMAEALGAPRDAAARLPALAGEG